MTETTPDDPVRRLLRRAVADAGLRERLLGSPRATVEEELGITLPPELEVEVLQETGRRVYLVLPPAGETGELSDGELARAAGGGFYALRSSRLGAFMYPLTFTPP
jgi:hypothetical protein